MLAQIYSRVLYMLAETTCRSLVEPQFSCRKFHQAHGVVLHYVPTIRCNSPNN